jgi:hypothetical protein
MSGVRHHLAGPRLSWRPLFYRRLPAQILGASPARSNTGVFSISLGPVPEGISSAACCKDSVVASQRVLRSRLFEGSIMPQSQRLSSAIPFVAIERPACPKCKAPMMLVSIEPARARGVDLHRFECAVWNQVLKTFAAYEDPKKSKGLGRWLQGELYPPK